MYQMNPKEVCKKNAMNEFKGWISEMKECKEGMHELQEINRMNDCNGGMQRIY